MLYLLAKTLFSHSVFLHSASHMGTGKLNKKKKLVVTCDGIASRLGGVTIPLVASCIDTRLECCPIHGDTCTDDEKLLFERTSNLRFQTEKQKDINKAKVLFPDFFPQAALQDTWEAESSWKARPTMEQIFSGQNNVDFSAKSGLHYNTNFEYWKRYQLSF